MAMVEDVKRVRKILNQYRFIKKELQARKAEYEVYLTEIYNPIQGVLLDGLPKGKGGISDPTGNRVARINQRELDYKKREIEKLEAAILRIETAINALDYQERCVLYYKYIVGVSWIDMPEYTYYQKTQNRKYETSGIEEIIRKKLL
ncbi:MAG: hypothetical protein MRZ66_00105 [Clostridiales bacterium]|nr:hypothetical protein [Clostridiales bacterium]